MFAGVGMNAAQACDNDRFPCPVVSEAVTQETAAAPAEPVQVAQPPKKASQSATKPREVRLRFKTAGDLEVKLDEARFDFPEHIQRLLKDIFSASRAKMVHLVERGEVSIDDPEKSAAKAKELNDDDQKLALFYAKLPENF